MVKMIETPYIIIKKSEINICSKIPQIFPSPWVNVVPSMQKLCLTVLAKNGQENVQPALNKGTVVRVSKFFVTDCRI